MQRKLLGSSSAAPAFGKPGLGIIPTDTSFRAGTGNQSNSKQMEGNDRARQVVKAAVPRQRQPSAALVTASTTAAGGPPHNLPATGAVATPTEAGGGVDVAGDAAEGVVDLEGNGADGTEAEADQILVAGHHPRLPGQGRARARSAHGDGAKATAVPGSLAPRPPSATVPAAGRGSTAQPAAAGAASAMRFRTGINNGQSSTSRAVGVAPSSAAATGGRVLGRPPTCQARPPLAPAPNRGAARSADSVMVAPAAGDAVITIGTDASTAPEAEEDQEGVAEVAAIAGGNDSEGAASDAETELPHAAAPASPLPADVASAPTPAKPAAVARRQSIVLVSASAGVGPVARPRPSLGGMTPRAGRPRSNSMSSVSSASGRDQFETAAAAPAELASGGEDGKDNVATDGQCITGHVSVDAPEAEPASSSTAGSAAPSEVMASATAIATPAITRRRPPIVIATVPGSAGVGPTGKGSGTPIPSRATPRGGSSTPSADGGGIAGAGIRSRRDSISSIGSVGSTRGDLGFHLMTPMQPEGIRFQAPPTTPAAITPRSPSSRPPPSPPRGYPRLLPVLLVTVPQVAVSSQGYQPAIISRLMLRRVHHPAWKPRMTRMALLQPMALLLPHTHERFNRSWPRSLRKMAPWHPQRHPPHPSSPPVAATRLRLQWASRRRRFSCDR